jgi:glycerophosphoryl diester phosphodiesterase
MSKPLIIGHRGASASAPENTLIAFELAMTEGADGIEFDVQLASDDVPVVIHDGSLKRTGLRPELVRQLSSIELARIDVGTWFNNKFPNRAKDEFIKARVPTLEEVMECFKKRDTVLYIEMKFTVDDYTKLARNVARLIEKHDLIDQVVVESFALDSICEIKRLNLDIRTAALFEPKLSRPVPSARTMIDKALAHEADAIALHRSLATTRAVEKATQSGLSTVVWTVDQPTWVAKAQRCGIDALITNRPEIMNRERQKVTPVEPNLSPEVSC